MLAWCSKIPFSSTPGILSSSFASVATSLGFHSPHAQSSVMFPPSVSSGFSLPPRITALPFRCMTFSNSDTTLRLVSCHAKGSISTGRGKAPSCFLTLFFSAMTIIFAQLCASIFSLSKHPPPPFMSRSFESISSAPSIIISMGFSALELRSASSWSSAMGKPSFFARARLFRELAMHISGRFSGAFARAFMNSSAVDPEPRAIRIFGFMYFCNAY